MIRRFPYYLPLKLEDIIIQHINKAFSRLEKDRYQQEPAYVSAFLGKMDEKFSFGGVTVDFKPTIINDRGKNAAESIVGADFSLTLEIKHNSEVLVKKSVIAQAKNKSTALLSKQELERLKEQYSKMRRYTDHSGLMIFEAPNETGNTPSVLLGIDFERRFLSEKPIYYRNSIPFTEYIVDHFIHCIHGNRNSDFCEKVNDSKLSGLLISIDKQTT